MAKQVQTKQEPKELSLPEANFFEQYGNSVTVSNITGQLLKFSKGDWLAGQDEDEIDPGTRLVTNMDQLLVGWQKWEDSRPTDRAMGFLAEGYKAPARLTLGSTDPSQWEVDATGKARDPWQFTNYLILKPPGKKTPTSSLFTFTTSSKGGLACIGSVCKEYGTEMRARPDEYPIVELGSSSYDHPNKEFGRIKTPTMKVVGWEKKALFSASK